VHAALVVVSIVCTKLHPVLVLERVLAGVTRVDTDVDRVMEHFTEYCEPAVVGVEPFVTVSRLELEPQLVETVLCQLVQQFVPQPVVAFYVVESNFELVPRTVEEIPVVVETFEVLLDQQRNAVF